jgi:hypothetical protein
MNYFNVIQEYLEKKPSIQLIPVKDKVPFMKEWQDVNVTSDVVDAWESEYLGYANGVGFRVGQHNIGAMDIDTDDIEKIYRIDEVMDLSQICAKKGLKGKTVFFRWEGEAPFTKRNIYQKQGDKKPIVEFFCTTGQIVLPPSIHPDTKLPYVWISRSLLDIDIEDLPIIDFSKIEYLETVLRASSLGDASANMPTGTIGEGSGKFITITSEAARLLHLGIDDLTIAKTLVMLDRRLHQGNQFFFSAKIGRDLISKTSDMDNAIVWIASYKSSLMRTDAELRSVMSNVAHIKDEIPSAPDWEKPKEIIGIKKLIEYPEHLYPDSCKQYCHDLARLSAMPPEAYMAALFVTFSAACQGRIFIHVKRDFIIHPSVSAIIHAPSGSRKDTIFDGAKAPLMKLIDAQLDKIDSKFIQNEENLISKLNDLDSKRKKAISATDEIALESICEEIRITQDQLMVHKSAKPNFIFESGSQEKLYRLMYDNARMGLFLCIPEFIQFMGTLGRSGNEGMRGFVLKLLNGSTKETHNHQTMNGLNINCKRVYGCSLVGVQTDTFAHEIKKMESGLVNDGLFQRYFIINVAQEIKMMEDIDRNVECARLDNVFALMYNNDRDIHVEWESEEVKSMYIRYEYKLNMAIQYDSSAVRSFRSKYSGQSVKIAYLFEQLNAKPGVIITKITKKSYLMAVEWIEWQSSCLEVTWSNTKHSTTIKICHLILDGIRSGQIKAPTFFADILRSIRFTTSEIRAAMIMLMDHGYIRRKGDRYEINPYA